MNRTRTIRPTIALLGLAWGATASLAPAADPPVRYSDAVVAKAERILEEHGLRRVGSQIQAIAQGELTEMLAGETRLRRAVRTSRLQWQEADAAVKGVTEQLEALEQQVGRWNAQYAAVGNPQGRNNELVARINAGTAQLKQLVRTRERLQTIADEQRKTLRVAEEEYAEAVLKMRRQVDAIRETVIEAAQVENVATAFRVLATRHETPEEIDVERIVGPLDRRVRKLEEAVFHDSIPLEPDGGGLFVQAVIGDEPVRMVVDSGSAVVLIPDELADKLEITPEPDARQLTMVTADGRRIGAKEVFLPRMRVGKFEAKDVRAALLDEAVAGAHPLLGLSFLEHFKFEIDAQEKTLRMLRVEDATATTQP